MVIRKNELTVQNNSINVLFRCDASLEIGSGHVMRCLTLANALRKDGAQCRFVCREYPGHLVKKIRAAGFAVVGLPVEGGWLSSPEQSIGFPKHAAWLGADWQTDAAQSFEAFPDEKFDWLVVDHYGIERGWENIFRGICANILVIDDLADRNHDCDILLDQNLVAEMDKRYAGLVPEDCIKLLGPKYALLQPEYAEFRAQAKPRKGPVKRILVYFGGADRENLTGLTIDAIRQINTHPLDIDVVINEASPYVNNIQKLVKDDPRFFLHFSIPTLARLMLGADLFIGAGGTTTWERFCLGLPSLVLPLAENQEAIAKELCNAGLIRLIDRKAFNDKSSLKKIIKKVIKDTSENQKVSLESMQVVDGNGVRRVTSILFENQIKIRKVQLADDYLLYEWINDPITRENSISKAFIKFEDHQKWLKDKLENQEDCVFLMGTTDGSEPFGVVRFDKAYGQWKVSFSVSKKFRGKGFGKTLLKKCINYLAKTNPNAELFAEVLPENWPSRKIFENLGFHEIVSERLIKYYRKAFLRPVIL